MNQDPDHRNVSAGCGLAFLAIVFGVGFLSSEIGVTASELLVLAATLAAAIGVDLNVRHDRRCFHLWLFSNAVQVVFAAWLYLQTRHIGAACQAMLFAYYWAQALRGLSTWRKGGEE